MNKLLWCGSLTAPTQLDTNKFFPKELVVLSEVYPDLATKIIDCSFVGADTLRYANVSADVFNACKLFVLDYEGLVLPNNPIFLSHFFFHAGIEFYTPNKSFNIYIFDKYSAPHQITILV